MVIRWDLPSYLSLLIRGVKYRQNFDRYGALIQTSQFYGPVEFLSIRAVGDT